jgi:predicted NAD/FAD-dependent oxidoreductase
MVFSMVDVVVIGAGMAGLTAASDLQLAGRSVLVIDKGRGVGGRLATRRIGEATLDHGAQFMTARNSRFASLMEEWSRLGLVEEWYRTGAKTFDPHPHWRGKPAMTAVAKYLVRDLRLMLGKPMAALRREGVGWVVSLESGETVSAGAVLLTPPVPQSLVLLEAGKVELSEATLHRLQKIEYERCFAVMAVLDGPSRIPQPGSLTPAEGPIAWIADNQAKGVSAIPAVTIHASAAFSLKHWDRDRKEVGRELIRTAEQWLGSRVSEFQVHGWRYSRPLRLEQETFLTLNVSPPLLIAGDAFAGPHVEGAALSGWAAADALK